MDINNNIWLLHSNNEQSDNESIFENEGKFQTNDFSTVQENQNIYENVEITEIGDQLKHLKYGFLMQSASGSLALVHFKIPQDPELSILMNGVIIRSESKFLKSFCETVELKNGNFSNLVLPEKRRWPS